jgi:hypothetical protein
MDACASDVAGEYSHGIFAETDIMEDLVMESGGGIIINRSTDGAQVEIVLPTA